jgi:hypothetical protein
VLTLKTGLSTLIDLTVTGVPPLLSKAPVWVRRVRTCKLGKEMLCDLIDSFPCWTAPKSGIVSVADPAVMVTASLNVPTAVGAKVTTNVVLWPALNVSGIDGSALRVNAVPVTEMAEMVMLVAPFVKVSVWVLDFPVWKVPKLMLAELGVSCWPLAVAAVKNDMTASGHKSM